MKSLAADSGGCTNDGGRSSSEAADLTSVAGDCGAGSAGRSLRLAGLKVSADESLASTGSVLGSLFVECSSDNSDSTSPLLSFLRLLPRDAWSTDSSTTTAERCHRKAQRLAVHIMKTIVKITATNVPFRDFVSSLLHSLLLHAAGAIVVQV